MNFYLSFVPRFLSPLVFLTFFWATGLSRSWQSQDRAKGSMGARKPASCLPLARKNIHEIRRGNMLPPTCRAERFLNPPHASGLACGAVVGWRTRLIIRNWGGGEPAWSRGSWRARTWYGRFYRLEVFGARDCDVLLYSCGFGRLKRWAAVRRRYATTCSHHTIWSRSCITGKGGQNNYKI